MTSETQARIDAITLLVENGCNGLSCDECPVQYAKGESKKTSLCLSIEGFNK